MSQHDTIFAPATGPGGPITILRASGPMSRFALETLMGKAAPAARRLSLRSLRDAAGEVLDQAMVVMLPGPGTFTGEDGFELHLHGGRAVLAAVAGRLLDLGLRPAEPGEFSRRAFVNGRMDLSQAEGLADLLHAETERQRRQAMKQMDGVLGAACARWRTALIGVQASYEAALDFSDEGDVPDDALDSAAKETVHELLLEIEKELKGTAAAERIRDGWTVALAGPPNAGKSSLLNALAGRDAAIVSDIPGTTRDAIEVHLQIDGWPVTIIDTAGLRETEDAVERMGIDRSHKAMSEADFILWLWPADEPRSDTPDGLGLDDGRWVVVRSKADVTALPASADIMVSAVTQAGIDGLREEIRRLIDSRAQQTSELVVRERHRRLLSQGRDALADALWNDGSLELVAEDVRRALLAIGQLTGHVRVDDVLDRVFGQFCIGK